MYVAEILLYYNVSTANLHLTSYSLKPISWRHMYLKIIINILMYSFVGKIIYNRLVCDTSILYDNHINIYWLFMYESYIYRGHEVNIYKWFASSKINAELSVRTKTCFGIYRFKLFKAWPTDFKQVTCSWILFEWWGLNCPTMDPSDVGLWEVHPHRAVTLQFRSMTCVRL